MRITMLAFLMILALPGAGPRAESAESTEGAAEAAPAKTREVKPVTRIYDVAALCITAQDYPGPEILPADAMEGNIVLNPFAASPAVMVTTASVADAIRNRVDPERWDPQAGTSIEERAGRLIVTQFPDVHAKIDALLDGLRRSYHRTVGVQALLVEPPADALKDYLGRAGKQIPQAGVDALLKDGKLLAMPQLLMFNGTRAHLFSCALTSYVANAQSTERNPEPIVQWAFAGTCLDVRPILNDDATAATLQMRLASTDRVTIGAGVKMALASPEERKKAEAAAAAAAAEEKQDEAKAEPLAPAFDLPAKRRFYRTQTATVRGRAVQQAIEAPIGKWVLAGILGPTGEAAQNGGGQALLLMLVTLP